MRTVTTIRPTKEYPFPVTVPGGSVSPYDFAVPSPTASGIAAFIGAKLEGSGPGVVLNLPIHDTIVYRISPPTGVTAYGVEFYELNPRSGVVRQLNITTGGPFTTHSPPIDVPKAGVAVAIRLVDVTYPGPVPTDPFTVTWQGVMRGV